MQIFISFLLFTVFISLSAIHIYWGFGGSWAIDVVFPTKEDGSKMYNRPGKTATFVVASGLFMFGLFYLIKVQVFQMAVPIILEQYGYWVIAIIFLLRATGDFNYIGLFKKVKTTPFGIQDSRVYTPLCISIVLLTLVLIFFP